MMPPKPMVESFTSSLYRRLGSSVCASSKAGLTKPEAVAAFKNSRRFNAASFFQAIANAADRSYSVDMRSILGCLGAAVLLAASLPIHASEARVPTQGRFAIRRSRRPAAHDGLLRSERNWRSSERDHHSRGRLSTGKQQERSEAYCADFLAPAGYAVFSINYRLAPKYPYPYMVYDVERAVRYLRHNAAKWNADPNKIALVGLESATRTLERRGALESKLTIPDQSR